jgi:membrane protease YdiL (CAAX protease family)
MKSSEPQKDTNSVHTNTAVVLAVITLFAVPYLLIPGTSPAKYLLPDIAILGVMAARFQGSSLRRMGLVVPPLHLGAALIALAGGVLLAGGIVEQISADRGIEIVGARPAFSLSQVLHQEIVLRGLLLGALARWFPSPAALAVLVAVIFAGVHPLLYWWSFDLVLPVTSIATLLGFGLATNILFIRSGHIAFSFAAHAAWNLVRFGDAYIVDGEFISEAQTFAVFEASWQALGTAAVFLAISVVVAKLLKGLPSMEYH